MSILTTGNAKRFLPIFDPSRIQDHNAEGFDSVDSEDFDPGFGCVPIKTEVPLKPPPPVKCPWMAEELEQEKYYQHWKNNFK